MGGKKNFFLFYARFDFFRGRCRKGGEGKGEGEEKEKRGKTFMSSRALIVLRQSYQKEKQKKSKGKI